MAWQKSFGEMEWMHSWGCDKGSKSRIQIGPVVQKEMGILWNADPHRLQSRVICWHSDLPGTLLWIGGRGGGLCWPTTGQRCSASEPWLWAVWPAIRKFLSASGVHSNATAASNAQAEAERCKQWPCSPPLGSTDYRLGCQCHVLGLEKSYSQVKRRDLDLKVKWDRDTERKREGRNSAKEGRWWNVGKRACRKDRAPGSPAIHLGNRAPAQPLWQRRARLAPLRSPIHRKM